VVRPAFDGDSPSLGEWSHARQPKQPPGVCLVTRLNKRSGRPGDCSGPSTRPARTPGPLPRSRANSASESRHCASGCGGRDRRRQPSRLMTEEHRRMVELEREHRELRRSKKTRAGDRRVAPLVERAPPAEISFQPPRIPSLGQAPDLLLRSSPARAPCETSSPTTAPAFVWPAFAGGYSNILHQQDQMQRICRALFEFAQMQVEAFGRLGLSVDEKRTYADHVRCLGVR
jgi:hypothetical protein